MLFCYLSDMGATQVSLAHSKSSNSRAGLLYYIDATKGSRKVTWTFYSLCNREFSFRRMALVVQALGGHLSQPL